MKKVAKLRVDKKQQKQEISILTTKLRRLHESFLRCIQPENTLFRAWSIISKKLESKAEKENSIQFPVSRKFCKIPFITVLFGTKVKYSGIS